MLDARTLSDLIGRIYDCALDPGLWSRTLDALRSELGFAHATLSLQALPSGRVLVHETSGIPSPWAERVGDYGADIVALWGGPAVIAAQPLEQPVVLSDLNPAVRDGSCRNRYFLEWRRPQGLIDTLTIGLARDEQSLATTSWVRHESQGPIGEAERQAARLFAPHLRRAVTISRLLEAQAVVAANVESALDGVRTPVILAAADLSVVHANAAGRALLDEGEPLSVREGRLVSRSPVTERALAAALEQALRDERGMARKGLGIPARGGSGAACVLHLLPLAGGPRRAALAGGAAVALFVASSRSRQAEVGELVGALFDLTPAERRVFDLVAQGIGVPGAARALGVGSSTVKTHLLRIFDKTGMRRQAELVRLAGSVDA